METKQNAFSDKRSADEFERITEEKRDEVGSDEEKNSNMKIEDHSAVFESEDAARKKTEDDDKLLSKVQDKSKPVSSTPVPGTPWYVKCDYFTRFFYSRSHLRQFYVAARDTCTRQVDKY